MGKTEIGVAEIGHLASALANHKELIHYFKDINPNYKEQLSAFIGDLEDRTHRSMIVQYWGNVNVHITNQTWGSTACGWGGMGGSAMTNAYNVIIENKHLNIFFVYWDGKLAYIAKTPEDMKFGSVAGLWECEKKYEIITKGFGY